MQKNHWRAPEDKIACCARSDQDDFCSFGGRSWDSDTHTQLRLAFILLNGVKQVHVINLPDG